MSIKPVNTKSREEIPQELCDAAIQLLGNTHTSLTDKIRAELETTINEKLVTEYSSAIQNYYSTIETPSKELPQPLNGMLNKLTAQIRDEVETRYDEIISKLNSKISELNDEITKLTSEKDTANAKIANTTAIDTAIRNYADKLSEWLKSNETQEFSVNTGENNTVNLSPLTVAINDFVTDINNPNNQTDSWKKFCPTQKILDSLNKSLSEIGLTNYKQATTIDELSDKIKEIVNKLNEDINNLESNNRILTKENNTFKTDIDQLKSKIHEYEVFFSGNSNDQTQLSMKELITNALEKQDIKINDNIKTFAEVLEAVNNKAKLQIDSALAESENKVKEMKEMEEKVKAAEIVVKNATEAQTLTLGDAQKRELEAKTQYEELLQLVTYEFIQPVKSNEIQSQESEQDLTVSHQDVTLESQDVTIGEIKDAINDLKCKLMRKESCDENELKSNTMRSLIEMTQKENKAAYEAIEKAKEEAEAAKKAKKEAEAQIAETKAQAEQAVAQAKVAEDAKKTAELAVAQEEVKAAEAEATKAKKEKEEAQAKAEVAEKEVKAANEAKINAEKAKTTAQEEVKAAEAEATKAKKEKEEAQAKAEVAEKEVKAAEAEATKAKQYAEAQIAEATKAKQDAEAQIAESKDRLLSSGKQEYIHVQCDDPNNHMIAYGDYIYKIKPSNDKDKFEFSEVSSDTENTITLENDTIKRKVGASEVVLTESNIKEEYAKSELSIPEYIILKTALEKLTEVAKTANE